MPAYQPNIPAIDVPRSAVLLDTNVLVAAFFPQDGRHDDATNYLKLLEEAAELPLIPIPVVVEAWGMLVGSKRRLDCGLKLIAWLSDSARVVLVPQHCGRFGEIRQLANAREVDIVDAMLVFLASEMSEQCGMRPPLRIATFDTRDFTRLCGIRGLPIRVHDLTTSDDLELSDG